MYASDQVKLSIRALFVIFCLSLSSDCFAKPVKVGQVRKVVDTFLKAENIRAQNGLKALQGGPMQQAIPRKFTTGGVREVRGDDGKILAYVTELGKAYRSRVQGSQPRSVRSCL